MDEPAKKTLELLAKIDTEPGYLVTDLGPFSGNFITFSVYHGLKLLVELVPTDAEKSLILRLIALWLQLVMIYVPICLLVNTLYKKNSATFRTLLSGVVLTCISLYGQVCFLDF